jgi:hypothetical protein
VHGDDVRVSNRTRRPCFAQQATAQLPIVTGAPTVRPHHLERHATLQLFVLGRVHDTHGTRAHALQNAVATHAIAGP